VTWWKRFLAALLHGRTEIRLQALEDQAAAYRQTIEALRYELRDARNRYMASTDDMLDRHEQLQAEHRELQRKYVAATQPRAADWMLAQGKAVRA
jgi:hypothetical protein